MQKILLVEDDDTIAVGLQYSLTQNEFAVTVCRSVEEAKHALYSTVFDLALLDLTLPDGSGYDICRQIRSGTRIGSNKEALPVIFLTACEEEVNIVMGLDMGADDYITKPFRVRELISRIRCVLRRCQTGGEAVCRLGNVTVDLSRGKVYKNGQDVFLTAMEYKLLLTLVNNRGRVLSREQLLEGIWDIAGDFVNDNTLSVYIKRLREKLEDDPQEPSVIKTVRGRGYQIDD